MRSLRVRHTERLHFHFSLSRIGEGYGNPLQCSCLENPRDLVLGGLPSMGSHRVGHYWSDLAAAAAKHLWLSNRRIKRDWGFQVAQGVQCPPTLQETQETRAGSRIGNIPWRRAWQPTPVFLPGEPHGWRSLGATLHVVAETRTWQKQTDRTGTRWDWRGVRFLSVWTPRARGPEGWPSVYYVKFTRLINGLCCAPLTMPLCIFLLSYRNVKLVM